MAIGSGAGSNTQGDRAIGLGTSAGGQSQGFASIAIGTSAARLQQLANAVAIGTSAGQTSQGERSIAIGTAAGSTNLGTNSIVIGALAQTTGAGSIVINATGSSLAPTTDAAFTVAPVRGVATSTPVLVYNATTKEITYNTSTRRIKKNIIDLTANTAHVYDIRPVEYDAIVDDKHFVGLIAEEVYEADPNFAWMLNEQPEGIEWFNILVYTVAELKKLRARVAVLESK
jgi:hypothetical protein